MQGKLVQGILNCIRYANEGKKKEQLEELANTTYYLKDANFNDLIMLIDKIAYVNGMPYENILISQALLTNFWNELSEKQRIDNIENVLNNELIIEDMKNYALIYEKYKEYIPKILDNSILICAYLMHKKEYKKIIELFKNSEVSDYVAKAYYNLGDIDKAREILGKKLGKIEVILKLTEYENSPEKRFNLLSEARMSKMNAREKDSVYNKLMVDCLLTSRFDMAKKLLEEHDFSSMTNSFRAYIMAYTNEEYIVDVENLDLTRVNFVLLRMLMLMARKDKDILKKVKPLENYYEEVELEVWYEILVAFNNDKALSLIEEYIKEVDEETRALLLFEKAYIYIKSDNEKQKEEGRAILASLDRYMIRELEIVGVKKFPVTYEEIER